MISVIIPTYNRRELLGRAVQSVLDQTEQATEILIMDDGSEDGTQEEWAHPEDGRVRYFRLDHGGACRARNEGLAQAAGEYAAFLDSDDTWERDKLEKQEAFLKETKADAVFCAFRHWNTRGEMTRRPGEAFPPGRVQKTQLLAENVISTQTIFGRTVCLRDTGFDERFPRLQDWDFALRLTEKYRVFYDPIPLADVYLQGDSISGDPEKAFRAIGMIHEKNRKDYAGNIDAARALMTAYYEFGSGAGRSCTGGCLRLLSAGRSIPENGYIFLRTIWLRLKQTRSGCLRGKG